MAVRLQRWFRTDGGFRYSLRQAPSGNGIDDLVHFLGTGKDSRVGYCEQFAAAMAVMGRTLKIPSRVAVGFLRPDRVGSSDTYVYSSHDLHAWPEMYFEGVGWVRFEPTPQARTGGVPSYTRQSAVGRSDTPTDTPSAALPTRNRIDQPSAAPGAGAGRKGTGAGGTAGTALVGTLGFLAVLLLLALPRLVRTSLRRRRWARAVSAGGLAEAGWAELRDSALDLGIAWDDHVTLRRRARELVRSFGRPDGQEDAFARASLRGPNANPEAAAALDRLVHSLERSRYARASADPAGASDQMRRDTETCVAAMRAGTSRQRRTRAAWLPASLWKSPAGGSRRRAPRAMPAGEPGIDHAV
jgi:hypothetical protein